VGFLQNTLWNCLIYLDGIESTFVMVFLDFYSHTHLVESKFIYIYIRNM